MTKRLPKTDIVKMVGNFFSTPQSSRIFGNRIFGIHSGTKGHGMRGSMDRMFKPVIKKI